MLYGFWCLDDVQSDIHWRMQRNNDNNEKKKISNIKGLYVLEQYTWDVFSINAATHAISYYIYIYIKI